MSIDSEKKLQLCNNFNALSKKEQRRRNNAFVKALKKGDLEKIKELLGEGVDPNLEFTVMVGGVFKFLYTPLTYILSSRVQLKPEEAMVFCKVLLGYGADPNKAMEENVRPLGCIKTRKNKDIVRLLLEAGADPYVPCSYRGDKFVDISDLDYQTHLLVEEIMECKEQEKEQQQRKENFHELVKSGDEVAVLACLQDGVDVNQTDDFGCTAAHYAAEYGHYVLLGLLIKKDADLTIQDAAGATAHDRAMRDTGNEYCRELLEEQNAPFNLIRPPSMTKKYTLQKPLPRRDQPGGL